MLRSTITKFKVSLFPIRRAPMSKRSKDSGNSGYPDFPRNPKYPETDISDLHNAFMQDSQKEKITKLFKRKPLEKTYIDDKIQDELFQIKDTDSEFIKSVPKNNEANLTVHTKESIPDVNKEQLATPIQWIYSSDNFKNQKFGSSPEADLQIAFDEIARRCLDAPFDEIDERLLRELENLKQPLRNNRNTPSDDLEVENKTAQPMIESEIDSKIIREYSKQPEIGFNTIHIENIQDERVNKFKKENLSQMVFPTKHSEEEDNCEKCKRLIAEAFGEPDYNNNYEIVKRVNNVSTEKILLMTSEKHEEEKLLRKLEKIDSPLVETEINNLDSSNIPPKVLGNRETIMRCEKKDDNNLNSSNIPPKALENRETIMQCEKKEEFDKRQQMQSSGSNLFITKIVEQNSVNPNTKVDPTLVTEMNRLGLVSQPEETRILNTSRSPEVLERINQDETKCSDIYKNTNVHVNVLKNETIMLLPVNEKPLIFSKSDELEQAPSLLVKELNDISVEQESKHHKNQHVTQYYPLPVTHTSYQNTKQLREDNHKTNVNFKTFSMYATDGIMEEKEESVSASEQICSAFVTSSPIVPVDKSVSKIATNEQVLNNANQTTLDNLMKNAVVHPSIKPSEILGTVEPLPNPTSISAATVNTETKSLNEMLHRVRQRNKWEFCKQFQMRMKEVDPIVGTCIKGMPPCPPPPPKCPPPSCPPPPPPCPPPPPPCPKPCKRACPPPCLPPKEKPCKCTSINSSKDFITLILNVASILKRRSVSSPLIFVLRSTFTPGIQTTRVKLTKEIEYNLYSLGTLLLIAYINNKIYNLQFEKNQEVKTKNNSSLVNARDFGPWIPIPCWPIPTKVEKRPLQTPNQGCKLLPPPPPSQPCKEKPCVDFPKRLFSLDTLINYEN